MNQILRVFKSGLPDSALNSSGGALSIDAAVSLIKSVLGSVPGTLWLLGNGGSAATALHMARDLNLRGIRSRSVSDPVGFSAASNDYGFEKSFSSMVSGHITNRDTCVFLSVSGNSRNLVNVSQTFSELKARQFALLGCHGMGSLSRLTDGWLAVNSNHFQLVEWLHFGLLAAASEDLAK